MFKPRIAIIGKPNVGKSTLFNRICGRRLAITHDRPGVTRDPKSYQVTMPHLVFELVDTAGLEKTQDELGTAMLSSALEQAKMADLLLFVVDGRNGLTAQDRDFAQEIRKLSKELILVINKCENWRALDLGQFMQLGFANFVAVSAEHNMGVAELLFKVHEHFDLPDEAELPLENDEMPQKALEQQSDEIKVAIIGRPNAGKSTLFNGLLGFKRALTSPVSGTTRDSIAHSIKYKGHNIELIDTAGLRKKTNVTDAVEQLAVAETINAVRRSHIVVMMLDGTCPLEKQDLSILRVAINEGRGVILVINKCDLLKDHKAYRADIDEYTSHKLFELKGLPVVYISALHEKNINGIWQEVLKVYDSCSKIIGTGALNRCLRKIEELHVPPLAKNGRRIRLKYIAQIGSRPPTFKIFGSMVNQLPESYERYIYNTLREKFQLFGVPIRIKCVNGANPYDME
jgi:GTP-binding protein